MTARQFCVALLLIALLGIPANGQATGNSESQPAADRSIVSARFPELAHVPAGRFLFGSPVENESAFEFRKCEKPQREVDVSEFWLGRFLVTAEEYCIFLNEEGADDRSMYKLPSWYTDSSPRYGFTEWATIRYENGRFAPRRTMERCPAFPVTWQDANRYCRWLTRKCQHEFRLPTEVEWEFGARGPELRRWPWGNEPPLIDRSRQAWRLQIDMRGRFGQDESLPDITVEDLGLGELVENQRRQSALDPPSSEPDARLQPPPIYQLYGERWIDEPFDSDRACLKYPVGSFPKNATPQGTYDLLAYRIGQWSSDSFQWQEESNSEWMHRPDADLRIVRGSSRVVVDRDIYGRTTPFLWKLIAAEGGPARTDGRSWSRTAADVRRGALLRVASSSPPSHR